MLKTKRSKRVRVLRAIATLLLLALAYLLVGAILPSYRRKSVSDRFVADFSSSAFYSDTSGTERVACIDDNNAALQWRLQLIRLAQEELILSTFDFRGDEAGLDIMAALWDAAERGVQIRLLVDGINGALYLNGSGEMLALAAHEKVEVRLYNKINLFKPWRAQYRLHDKYIIADRTAFLLGGRNTNELFLGETDGRQNIDRDLLVYEAVPSEESAMEQLRQYFEAVWADPACSMLHGKQDDAGNGLSDRFTSLSERFPDAFAEPDWIKSTMETNRISLLSNPAAAQNKEPTMWYAVTQLMHGSQEVLIETPYIICGRGMLSDLAAAADSGTQISILTNAVENGANPFGCSDYLRHKPDVLETGAAVYEYCGARSRHTKTILIDDRLSLVGSYNLDMRSTYLDTELMLAVDCPELNQQLREQAYAVCEACRLDLPDGTYQFGSDYKSDGSGTLQTILYKALGFLLTPIRHLL